MLIFTIQGASGAAVDYTRYVEAPSFTVHDEINVPTTCDFTLTKSHPAFVPPVRGQYVKIYSSKHDLYVFTGYITAALERVFRGMAGLTGTTPGKIYQYSVQCTSDEYLLNNKATTFIPAFVNQTQGDILASIAEVLTPGFFDVSSHVASGDIVPYFQYDPKMSWSQLAKQFADASRYRYKVIDKTIWFVPYGDAPLGIIYDETAGEGTFDPRGLKSGVLQLPVVNDVTVVGDVEAGEYVRDLFVGDGFTSKFVLSHEAFHAESALLIQEDWTGDAFNTQTWEVADPLGQFTLFQGALNVVSTGASAALGTTYIKAKGGLELGGTLQLQHGEFEFTGPSTGYIGGVYEDATLATDKLLFGFEVAASGAADTEIWRIINGARVGDPIGVELGHHYVFVTEVTGTQQARYSKISRTINGVAFGGVETVADAYVRLMIQDTTVWTVLSLTQVAVGGGEAVYSYSSYTGQAPVVGMSLTTTGFVTIGNNVLDQVVTGVSGGASGTVTVAQTTQSNETRTAWGTTMPTAAAPDTPSLLEYFQTVQGVPAFALYVPIHSVRIQAAITTLIVNQPSQGLLLTAPAATGGQLSWSPQTLGFGYLYQTATLTKGANQSSLLEFYSDSIPPPYQVVSFRYRARERAVGRVRDSASIATEAALVGDDGVRGTILTDLNPLPRTSEECEYAALARVEDATRTTFQGQYDTPYAFWNPLVASAIDVTSTPASGTVYMNHSAPLGNWVWAVLWSKFTQSGARSSGFSVLGFDSEAANYPATQSLDQNAITLWSSNNGASGWIAFDLGTVETFNEVVLTTRGDSNQGSPNAFDVYVSDDGLDWGTVIASLTGSNNTGGNKTRYDLGATYAKRYVKLVINSVYSPPSNVVIAEFDIGPAAPTILPSDAVVKKIYAVVDSKAYGTDQEANGGVVCASPHGLWPWQVEPGGTAITPGGAWDGQFYIDMTGPIAPMTFDDLSRASFFARMFQTMSIPTFDDHLVVRSIGFAIYYTSATPRDDSTTLAPPVEIPAGQGVAWSYPQWVLARPWDIGASNGSAEGVGAVETDVFHPAYNAGGPVPGRYLPINAPDRGMVDEAPLVRSVTWTVREMQDEIYYFSVAYGQDLYLDKLLTKFVKPQNVLRPDDTAQDPIPQVLAEVGTAFIGDLDKVQVLELHSTQLTLDLGAVPVTGVEIRRSDLGWGKGPGNNLVSTYTTQQIVLTRSGFKETFFLRQVNGVLTSRRSTVVQVNAPLYPPKATNVSGFAENSTRFRVSFALPSVGNFLDIYRIVIRNQSTGEVYAEIPWDGVTFSFVQYEISTSVPITATFTVEVATYNLLDETAPDPGATEIAYSGTAAMITGLVLAERTRSNSDGSSDDVILATWDAVTDPFVTIGGAIEVEWKQGSSLKVAGSSTFSFGTAVTSGSGDAWSNPGNAKVEDGAVATITLYNPNHTTQNLVLTNAGASGVLPANATIKGIKVDVKLYESSGTSAIYIDNVHLVGVTSGRKSDVYPNAWPRSLTFRSYGGPGDLWGISNPTVAMFTDSGFGVSLHTNCTLDPGSGGVADVDFVRITFYYTTPDTTTGTDYQTTPLLIGTETSDVVGPVVAGPTVSVRVRADNRFGAVGAWAVATIDPTGSGPLLTAAEQDIIFFGSVPATGVLTTSLTTDPAPGSSAVFGWGGSIVDGGNQSTGGVAVYAVDHTILSSERGMLLVFDSATAVSASLPSSIPDSKWFVQLANIGAGSLIVSGNGQQIDLGASPLIVGQYQGIYLEASAASGYFTERGMGAGGSPVTFAGDLGGSTSSQEVIGIGGIPLDLSSSPASGQIIQYNGTTGKWGFVTERPMRIVSAVLGKPVAGGTVLIYTATETVIFPANFASPASRGSLGTNPTSTATYTVYKNGVSVGTVQISTGGLFTFATSGGAQVWLVAGDRMTMTAPGSQDATLADVGITLVGTRK